MEAYHPFTPAGKLPPMPGGGPIVLREEQEEAVRLASKQFGKTNKQGVFSPDPAGRKFLWNAKMRFGKTLCAMELVRRMGVRRTLIVTHRPVVDQEWEDNFKKIFTTESGPSPHYDYGRKSVGAHQQHGDYYKLEEFVERDSHNHYVFFASMQYLRRSSLVTGRDNEDEDELKKRIFLTPWDLVIIDEAHEGTRTALGRQVMDLLRKEHTKMLHLSGTPFNLYEDFRDSEIYTWDYIQEQQAKREWAKRHPGEYNPYAELPRMRILTFDLSRLIHNFVAAGGEFKFTEFFRTHSGHTGAGHTPAPRGMEGRFVHEEAVRQFLDKLCQESETSHYPFAREEYRAAFHHTLWIVPGVKEARALQKLLEGHPIFGGFRVINVAGRGEEDEQREDALDKVKEAIKEDPEQGYTITISCGRLTTGVTVRQWTAVFYLKGSEMTSASTYMQTIFRVQSPWVNRDKQGRVERMKQECYVFDFAPQRTLKMVAETAKFSSHAKRNQKKKNADGEEMTQEERDKLTMREFLELCPVLSIDGGEMKSFDENRLFAQLNSVYVDRLVLSGFDDNCLYNPEELMKMDSEALKKIGEKIGQVPGMGRPPKPTPGSELLMTKLTEEQRRLIEEAKRKASENRKNGKKACEDLTPEELAAHEAWRKAREQAREERNRRISNIRGISLRIPLLMYGGADAGNRAEDLTTDNFTQRISDESWAEFMPKDVTKADFDAISRCFNATRFEEAGKRYRALAREADDMGVEDRIHRIAQIFACFRNPDKETVLTPWRVVNMHMSDTLGGYCFWNERFDGPNEKWLDNPTNGELFESVPTREPRFVDRGDVTREVFGNFENTKILEINSKTGLYPLYVAYQLFRTRMPDYLKAHCIAPGNTTPQDEQVVWDDVLAHCIFVICNTPMAKLITRRTLCGFRDVKKVNIKNDKLIERATQDQDALVADIKRAGYWHDTTSKEEMKFNAVVGNPPYQKEGNNTRKAPIYHKFYDLAFEISDKVTLITPGRFLFKAGQTPKEWMDKILADEHFKVVRYYQKTSDIFPSVDIKGGVVITYYDSQQSFGAIGVFSEYSILSSILIKVSSHPQYCENEFAELVSSQGLYKFTEKAFEDFPTIVDVQGKGTAAKITSKAFKNIPSLFLDTKPNNGDYIQMMGLVSNKRAFKWIKREYVEPVDSLDYYKVIVPEANGTGAIGEVLSTPIIGLPIIGHTDTFLSIGRFEKSTDARNCLLYVQTKFARTMLGILKATQHNPKNTWMYVPMQDFTSSSDIDWSLSVAEIDRQLYRKYGLTAEETAFIERMIKPME